MSGTTDGGLTVAATNKELYGDDFYRRIGAKGGKVKGRKGFALNRELAREAGAIGGSISRRGPGPRRENNARACYRGHLLDGANVVWVNNRDKKYAQCRACNSITNKLYRLRKQLETS